MNAECRMQNAELKSGVQSHSAFCILHSAFVVILLVACGAKQKPAEDTAPVTVAVAQLAHDTGTLWPGEATQ